LSLFQKNKGGGGGGNSGNGGRGPSLLDVIILSVLEVAEEAVLAVNLPVEDLAEAVDSVEDLAVEAFRGGSAEAGKKTDYYTIIKKAAICSFFLCSIIFLSTKPIVT
jgi:hypothetical protein